VLELCREMGVEVVIPEREAEKTKLPDDGLLATIVPSLEDEQVDLCVALGGDGTILRAFSRFRDMQTPVLGINFGRMGFLTAMGPDEISTGLRAVLAGDYHQTDLALLQIEQETNRLALNDVVVHKPEGGSVVRLGYSVGDIDMDSFLCDGLVVATPGGSTAYNLSTGGPIVSPGLQALILSAIAPHTLRSRPLVLAGDESVKITNNSFESTAAVYVDGQQAGSMPPGETITITLSERRAHLVKATGASFFRTLRDKFINPAV
jgi:NAD+ kinase